MSWIVVRPSRRASANALRAPSASSAALGGGIARATSGIAASLSTPAGSRPPGRRTIVPPSGSGVAALTPAARSAVVLATAMWPSYRVTNTGRSAT
jgi:hypothetical protein